MAEETNTTTPPDIQKQTEDLAKKLGTDDTQVKGVTQEVKDEELLTTEGKTVDKQDDIEAKTLDPDSITKQTVPDKDETIGQITGDIKTARDEIEKLNFEGVKSNLLEDDEDLINLDDLKGTLSEGAMADPAQQEMDERATTQYQLQQLLEGVQEGKPLPPWASPAVRKVSAIMAQRGLGGSSMAAAAMTQAVMESGIAIASKDADAFAVLQLKNLDNRQQAALQNALQIATMDIANANNRTKGAITNAQALLSIDLAELDSQQKSNAIKFSGITQAALNDAAAENARDQFNAKSELQLEEFFLELSSQIDSANINRDVAIAQFNINQENAFAEFNATREDLRQKFNANMRNVIDQSNAKWRREVNTANTATQNEVNRINTQLTYNMSATALNDLWQQYRDNATFNFTASESELQRLHEQVLQALDAAANADAYDKAAKSELAKNVLKVIGAW